MNEALSQTVTTLSGYAVPLVVPQDWDHTYVVSSCGLRWGCFGRDIGGGEIARGSGSRSIAACLAAMNSEAGIQYLLTGVCHQASNRILFPAGIDIARANGYALSVMIFGKYGRGIWKERRSCVNAGEVGTRDVENGDIMKPRGFSPLNDESQLSGDDLGARADFLQLIEDRLPELSPTQIELLLGVQQQIREKQETAVKLLSDRTINSSEYLTEMRGIAAEAVSLSSQILNEKQAIKLFEAAVLAPDGFIDEGAFFKSR